MPLMMAFLVALLIIRDVSAAPQAFANTTGADGSIDIKDLNKCGSAYMSCTTRLTKCLADDERCICANMNAILINCPKSDEVKNASECQKENGAQMYELSLMRRCYLDKEDANTTETPPASVFDALTAVGIVFSVIALLAFIGLLFHFRRKHTEEDPHRRLPQPMPMTNVTSPTSSGTATSSLK